jgi:hypothetical protein
MATSYATTEQLAGETASRKSADMDLDARLKAVEAKLGITPPVTPPVQPPVTPPVTPTTGSYGTGLSGDSRNNHQVGWTNRARLSFRFRGTQTSQATSIRVQERGDVPTKVYSGGNGGTIRCSIQTDSGGNPSGTVLGTLQWSPGNPNQAWEVWTLHTFPTPVAMTAGTLYHLVFENVAADPVNNWISFNVLFHYGSTPTPRTAAFTDDFATLYATTAGWKLEVPDVPIFDLAYANGQHDGQAYIGTLADRYGLINGANNMAREKFTVSGGDRQVQKAHIRCRRISGTGPLTVALVNGDGSLIISGTVASSQVATGVLPGPGAALQGDTWAHVTFATPTFLTNGKTYALRLSTDAATTYTVVPLQQGTSKGLASRVFADGDGQRTTDGGANWANLYPYDSVDLQFWLD